MLASSPLPLNKASDHMHALSRPLTPPPTSPARRLQPNSPSHGETIDLQIATLGALTPGLLYRDEDGDQIIPEPSSKRTKYIALAADHTQSQQDRIATPTTLQTTVFDLPIFGGVGNVFDALRSHGIIADKDASALSHNTHVADLVEQVSQYDGRDAIQESLNPKPVPRKARMNRARNYRGKETERATNQLEPAIVFVNKDGIPIQKVDTSTSSPLSTPPDSPTLDDLATHTLVNVSKQSSPENAFDQDAVEAAHILVGLSREAHRAAEEKEARDRMDAAQAVIALSR